MTLDSVIKDRNYSRYLIVAEINYSDLYPQFAPLNISILPNNKQSKTLPNSTLCMNIE